MLRLALPTNAIRCFFNVKNQKLAVRRKFGHPLRKVSLLSSTKALAMQQSSLDRYSQNTDPHLFADFQKFYAAFPAERVYPVAGGFCPAGMDLINANGAGPDGLTVCYTSCAEIHDPVLRRLTWKRSLPRCMWFATRKEPLEEKRGSTRVAPAVMVVYGACKQGRCMPVAIPYSVMHRP